MHPHASQPASKLVLDRTAIKKQVKWRNTMSGNLLSTAAEQLDSEISRENETSERSAAGACSRPPRTDSQRWDGHGNWATVTRGTLGFTTSCWRHRCSTFITVFSAAQVLFSCYIAWSLTPFCILLLVSLLRMLDEIKLTHLYLHSSSSVVSISRHFINLRYVSKYTVFQKKVHP